MTTYKIHSREEINKQGEGLKVMVEILDSFPISWILAAGALLGIYRSGDLIPWDTDVDFDLRAEGSGEFFNEIVDKIKEKKFKSRGIIPGNKIVVCGYGHRYALRFWGDEGDGTFRRKFKVGYWVYPKRFLEDRGKIEFKGMLISCPKDTEGYLEHVYGPKWRVPYKPIKTYKECYTKKYYPKGGRL